MTKTGRQSERPFAVFDIDGTLIRWQLYHAIVDELGRRHHIAPELHEQIIEARRTWKDRRQGSSFSEYEETLVDVYHRSLVGLSERVYHNAIDTVFETYKDQVYTYTRDLIRDLKAKGYLLFALSGSQQEVVQKLGGYYGFDEVLGTVYERVDGHFSGKWRSVYGHKAEILQEFITRHGLQKQGSVAIGDSLTDAAMLELVEHPIAFNPDRKLFQVAQKNGWRIVLERKNMIYELEKHGKSYILADTDKG